MTYILRQQADDGSFSSPLVATTMQVTPVLIGAIPSDITNITCPKPKPSNINVSISIVYSFIHQFIHWIFFLHSNIVSILDSWIEILSGKLWLVGWLTKWLIGKLNLADYMTVLEYWNKWLTGCFLCFSEYHGVRKSRVPDVTNQRNSPAQPPTSHSDSSQWNKRIQYNKRSQQD